MTNMMKKIEMIEMAGMIEKMEVKLREQAEPRHQCLWTASWPRDSASRAGLEEYSVRINLFLTRVARVETVLTVDHR